MLVLPDVLANAGGVVVSYFEWVQGLQEYFWKEDEVNAQLNEIVTHAFDETWATWSDAHDLDAHRRLRARRSAGRRGDRDPRAVSRSAGVTLYTPHGCHLCERARGQLARSAGGARLRATTRSTSPAIRRSRRAYREWLPVVEIDGERAFVYYLDEAALAAQVRHKPEKFVTSRTDAVGDVAAQWLRRCCKPRPRSRLDRPAHCRRRRASLALSPGAHAGEEDGQGAHLLAGDRRLHEHQRDPDPPRPLELRQVRQARRRLLDRLAARRDPQDPAHAGAAQHRARRRRPPRRGDRELADLRRARHQHRGGLRHRPGQDRHDRVGTTSRYDVRRLKDVVRDKNIIVGVLAVPAARAQQAADDLVDAGVRIIFNYSEALLDVPGRRPCTRRTRRSSSSTRSTST